MAKKHSSFDYEMLVRFMLPNGILDYFEITKRTMRGQWGQVMSRTDESEIGHLVYHLHGLTEEVPNFLRSVLASLSCSGKRTSSSG